MHPVSFRFSSSRFSNHGTRKTVRKTKRISVVWGLFLDSPFRSRLSSVVQFLGLQQGRTRVGGSRRQDQIIKDVSCTRHSSYTRTSSSSALWTAVTLHLVLESVDS
jgi:hypothetical protein